MKITVVGTGYVGLVTGACFAQMGNEVTCVDIDTDKLARLNLGDIPIYEPGLPSLVKESTALGLLRFTSNLDRALSGAKVLFIAVGTPPDEDGSADLSHVLAVAKSVGESLSDYLVIVNKSTVPVGTAEKVAHEIQGALSLRNASVPFDVVSNPEFLKEGAAVQDFMKPDRIIVGVESERAERVMRELYAPFSRNHDKLQCMGVRDAEMTKYAANAMLATKISFMNEIANVCDRLGVDVEHVRKGIGADQRIGYSFIYPGCGYGGSCFPKDVKALIQMSKAADFDPWVLDAVERRNQAQKSLLIQHITERFSDQLSGLTFGIWGLAFKPGTDDMREAPSIPLIKALIARGAQVRAFDPVAIESAKQVFPSAWIASGQLVFTDQPYASLQSASALVLVTEWKVFRQPDFERIKQTLSTPVIIDGRNQYSPHIVKSYGFEYVGVGRRQHRDPA